MKKQTMMQATFIMVIVGFITKILGVVGRIVITRSLGESGIAVYMLISPTVMLLATIVTIGLPVAIPALVSRGDIKEKKLLSTAMTISATLSITITILMFFAARTIAVYLLKDDRVILPLMLTGPLMLTISFTSILKSYFQGKENMTPGAISTLAEQIVRMGASVVFIKWLLPRGIPYAVSGLMLASIAGELFSAIVLVVMFFSFKRKTYPRTDFKLPKLEPVVFKGLLGISLPTTGSRLVGTIIHFLEPIIVARMLFFVGYSNEASTAAYGAFFGFAVPLLFMPSFISNAVTGAIIPTISKAFKNRDLSAIHKRLGTSFRIAFFTCGFYLALVMVFPNEIMQLLYNSTTGAEFLKITAPIFLIYYFQSAIVAALQAIGEAKFALQASVISSTIKIGFMILLMSIEGVGIWGLVYATLFNIILLTAWYFVIMAKKIGYKLSLPKLAQGSLVLGVVYVAGQYLREVIVIPGQLLQIIVVAGILFVVHIILSFFTGLMPR